MPWMLLAAQAATLGATNYTVDAPMTAPTTKPTFADEFDGPAIDTAKWRYDIGFNKTGWFNNERQYYGDGRPENSRIENGALVIEARREALSASAIPTGAGRRTPRRSW